MCDTGVSQYSVSLSLLGCGSVAALCKSYPGYLGVRGELIELICEGGQEGDE